MSVEAKLTSKGQVTVPIRIRRGLGVKPGDSLIFDDSGDAVTIRPMRKENPFEKYRGIERKGSGVSKQEIISELRRMRDGGDGD